MKEQIDKLAEELINLFPQAEIDNLAFEDDLAKYQDDPVGFIEKYFNVFLPDKLKEICESVRDNRVTIAQSCTGFGKTFCAGLLAIWAYKCFPESITNCLASPPERNLKEKLLGEVRSQMRANKKMFSKDRITTLKISDDNSSDDDDSSKSHAILGIAIPTAGDDEQKQSRISGSHAPFQFFFLDEVDGIHDAVIKAIEGCMSGNFERMLGMFNPKSRSGEIYRKIKNGQANVIKLSAFDHPNVITGKDIIPGAVSRSVTIRRINNWTKPLAPGEEHSNKTCFEVPNFLVGTTTEDDSGKNYPPLKAGWRRVENQAFFYMTLGEYPAQSNDQLISTEWIDKARSRWDLYVAANGETPPKGVRPTIGMDVSDDGGDWNTACARYGGFVARIKKWKSQDIEMSAHKCADYHAELHALITNVESDGLGASVAPTMGRRYYYRCEKCEISHIDDLDRCPECEGSLTKYHVDSKKVKVGSKPTGKCLNLEAEFGLMRDQLWWSLRTWLKDDDTAMLPPSKELIEELEVMTYEVDKTVKVLGKKMIKKLLGRSPDEADALIETFYSAPVPKIRMV